MFFPRKMFTYTIKTRGFGGLKNLRVKMVREGMGMGGEGRKRAKSKK